MLINIKDAYTDRVPLNQVILAHKLRPTNPVTEINEILYKEVKMALKACLAYDGVGIAANQIGINKSFFLIRENEENFRVYFNPKVKTFGHLTVPKKEGCLSVPGYQLLVGRPVEIVVQWQEIENNQFVLKENCILRDDEARVFLHEFDHLKGVSIIDKSCELNRAGKREILKNLSQR